MRHIYLIGFLLSSYFAAATHYRSAEISSRLLAPLTLEVSVTTYAKWSQSGILADRDSIEVAWGDGTLSILYRVNGPDLGTPVSPTPDGIPDGEVIENDLKKNIYTGVHTYATLPASGMYVVSFTDLNRMAGISNIDNSVNVPMYVEHSVNLAAMSSTGSVHTPLFTVPPAQYGNVGDTLVFNPGPYDADGDGLEFSIVTPLQDSALAVPIYSLPDMFCSVGQFSINANTGDVSWISPCQVGIYSIAIQVKEYRGGLLLSTSIRDMQFIILDEPNNPSFINRVRDTIIAPGTLLQYDFLTSDDAGDTLLMEMFAPQYLSGTSPAVFTSQGHNPATGTFRWMPDTTWLNEYPYIFTIRARDNHTSGPIPAGQATFSTFRVWVADSNTVITGVEEAENDLEISVFPNPAQNFLYLRSVSPIQMVNVYTTEGGLIFNSQTPVLEQKIDIFGYTPGLYVVQAVVNNSVLTRKFIRSAY